MGQLTRRSGFDTALDDLMKGFFVRPLSVDDTLPQRIPVEVKEQAEAFVILAELPGVRKEDIHVEIDGGLVEISAEVKQEKSTRDGERLLRSERYFGSVSRSFQLPQEVDQAAAVARYADGVLELTLPKKQGQSRKQLTIK